MKRNASKKKYPITGEQLFFLLSMPCALSYAELLEDSEATPEHLPAYLCVSLFFMAVGHIFRAFRVRQKSRLLFGYHLGCAALMTGLFVLTAACGHTDQVCFIINLSYWIMIFFGRVQYLIRKHTVRSVLVNLVFILMIALAFLATLLETWPLWLTMYIAATQALFFIMEGVFVRVRIDILRKIIRKTYAAEILFGLLLLIVAISYMLSHSEESLTSMEDALWYCFAIVTTIGFGDYTATTPLGRILSMILGLYGIIVVALVTSVIVNFYGEMKKDPDDEDEENTDAGALPDGEDPPAEAESQEERPVESH